MRRIVDSAVDLAEQGGFQAVRLRDVAARSGVALGTLYKYFRSKEDLLLFALSEEIARLEAGIAARLPAARKPLPRVVDFFARATRGFARKPRFARAVLRAMATGDRETALKIAGVQLRITRLILAALRATPPDLAAPLDDSAGNARERAIGLTLQNVWFASLIGWSVGLHDEGTVVAHVRAAAELILKRDRAVGAAR
jgi:AcrR family transcriptional regulator